MSFASIHIKLPISVKKKKKWFLASCEVLDVHAQGETKQQAIDNLKDTLELFLTSCFERGTLDKVLKDCGFSIKEKASITDKNYLDIPLNLTTDNKSVEKCHA